MSQKLATLFELQTVYSFCDALDLYEIIAVNNYNEALAHQIAEEVSNRGR